MKRVFIDRANGVVMVNGRKIPRLLLRLIRGAVGKSFVVKHYKGGRVVVTKFPDMKGIVASGKQQVRREMFREAVVYAKWIVADEERKRAFRKALPWKKGKHVYQAAIRLYMRMQGDRQWLRKQLAVRAITRMQREDVLATNGAWVGNSQRERVIYIWHGTIGNRQSTGGKWAMDNAQWAIGKGQLVGSKKEVW